MESVGIPQKMPPGWYTRSQVASKIGKSTDTVRRWHEVGIYKSTRQIEFGSMKVWVYSDEDVAEMKRIARTTKPGRKAKEV